MVKRIKGIVAMICCVAMVITFIPTFSEAATGDSETANQAEVKQSDKETNIDNAVTVKQEKAATTSASKYIVKFVDWDGRILKTETVTKGTAATPPANPSRKGFEFKGWDGNFGAVTSNTTVTAKYTTQYIYTVEINYIIKGTNAPAANPYTVELPYGAEWKATSPNVTGYKLEDTSQAVLSGTIDENSKKELVIDVYYVPNTTIQYKVQYYQKGLDGKYVLSEEETKYESEGSIVTADKKSYEGFECVTDNTTGQVTADGKTVIKIYYDRKTYGIYFTTKGTYIPTIYAKYGEDVSLKLQAALAETPVRVGYTFTEWAGDTNIINMPAADQYINAVYEGKVVNYRVVHWVQKADLTGYEYYSSEEMSGLGDSQVQVNVKTDIEHFEYNEDNPKNLIQALKTINGNGNTVVNVYYDRVNYKVIYKIAAYGNQPITEYETIEAPYGSAISVPSVDDVKQAFYDRQGITDSTAEGTPLFYLWYNPDINKYWVNQPTTMPAPDNVAGGYTELRATFTASKLSAFSFRNYYQQLDGTYPDTPSVQSDFSFTSNTLYLTDKVRGFTLSEYRKTPFGNTDESSFEDWQTATAGTAIANWCIVEIRYTRNTYTVDYISNGDIVKTDSKQYEENLDCTKSGNDYFVPTNGPDGDVFVGWYEDEDFVKKADVTTMPADNKVYYAKWMSPYYTVTFETEGGSEIDEQQVVKGESIDSSTTNSVRPGYSFEGWYYENGSRYDMDAPVNSNLTLVAHWKPANNIKYTIKHVMKDTGALIYEEEKTGSMDELVNAKAIVPGDDNYPSESIIADLTSKSINLDVNESKNVITFYYTPFTETTYKVNYISVDMNGNETIMDTKDIVTSSIVVTERAKSFHGYVPAEYYITQALGSDTSENIINFYYTTNTAVKYIVEHYKVDANGVVKLANREVKYAPNGATVTGIAKKYEDYTFDEERSKFTMTGMTRLSSDSRGGLVLQLFYTTDKKATIIDPNTNIESQKNKTKATKTAEVIKVVKATKTGDDSDMMPYGIVMMIALAGVVIGGIMRKKEN